VTLSALAARLPVLGPLAPGTLDATDDEPTAADLRALVVAAAWPCAVSNDLHGSLLSWTAAARRLALKGPA